VYTFTKLHDRRIPNGQVGVGVGPVEFKLKATLVSCYFIRDTAMITSSNCSTRILKY